MAAAKVRGVAARAAAVREVREMATVVAKRVLDAVATAMASVAAVVLMVVLVVDLAAATGRRRRRRRTATISRLFRKLSPRFDSPSSARFSQAPSKPQGPIVCCMEIL